jgi:molybdopterin-guanine dinucleotide biosynthesis protein A
MTREQKADQKRTGIILAGGQSSRMGREKGLIRWHGKTLVENAVDVLSPLCDRILISANKNHYDFLGYQVVNDLFPACGPMGGIFSALSASDTMDNLVIPTDTPFVTTEMYRYLILQLGTYDAVVPVDHDSFFQPLCAIYTRTILPAMEAQINHHMLGFSPLFRQIHLKAVPFQTTLDFYHTNFFYNINSPADLEAISRKD